VEAHESRFELRARRPQEGTLKTLPEKWLQSRPESGFECLICSKFARHRTPFESRCARAASNCASVPPSANSSHIRQSRPYLRQSRPYLRQSRPDVRQSRPGLRQSTPDLDQDLLRIKVRVEARESRFKLRARAPLWMPLRGEYGTHKTVNAEHGTHKTVNMAHIRQSMPKHGTHKTVRTSFESRCEWRRARAASNCASVAPSANAAHLRQSRPYLRQSRPYLRQPRPDLRQSRPDLDQDLLRIEVRLEARESLRERGTCKTVTARFWP